MYLCVCVSVTRLTCLMMFSFPTLQLKYELSSDQLWIYLALQSERLVVNVDSFVVSANASSNSTQGSEMVGNRQDNNTKISGSNDNTANQPETIKRKRAFMVAAFATSSVVVFTCSFQSSSYYRSNNFLVSPETLFAKFTNYSLITNETRLACVLLLPLSIPNSCFPLSIFLILFANLLEL